MVKKTTLAALLAAFALPVLAEETGVNWRATGDFHYGMSTWQCDLVSYDDDTYVIENWYQRKGAPLDGKVYDFEFSVNKDYSLHIITGRTETNGTGSVYQAVPAYQDKEVWFPQDGETSFVSYGKGAYGKITLTSQDESSIYFEWPAQDWRVIAGIESSNPEAEPQAWRGAVTHLVDGTYVVEAWAGYENYDLRFTLNDDNTLHITNGFSIGGMADDQVSLSSQAGEQMNVYQDSKSTFEGDNLKGTLTYTDQDGVVYTVTWPVTEEGTVWEVNGKLEFVENGEEKCNDVRMVYRDKNFGTESEPEYVRVLELVDWYYPGFSLDFTINEDKTLHIENRDNGWFLPEYVNVPYMIMDGNTMTTYVCQDSKSEFNGDSKKGDLYFTIFTLEEGDVEFRYSWEDPNASEDDPVFDSVHELQGEGAVEAIYDLQGRQVKASDSLKGFYILRGAKGSRKVVF